MSIPAVCKISGQGFRATKKVPRNPGTLREAGTRGTLGTLGTPGTLREAGTLGTLGTLETFGKLMLAKITLGTEKSNSGHCEVIRAWHGLNALGQIQ